ncbi:MAG: Lrp/AsnC family transcriptional regulator [Rhodothermaceae bacterium]
MKFDKIDRQILEILQENSNITNAQLAAEVGISPPGMLERVKRLEKSGVIRKCVALVDFDKVEKNTMAMVSVSIKVHDLQEVQDFKEKVGELEEVLECYHIAGEEDFLLKVAVKDIKEYEKFVLNKLNPIEGISRLKTTFVLSTIKYDTRVRIENSDEK